MSSRFKQGTYYSGATRFTQSPIAEVEFSKFSSPCRVLTDMNAGDITPVLCLEVLPHDTFSIDFNYVNRLLSAAVTPTMGEMQFELFAFFAQNRVLNESWKNVQGENTSGFWAAPEVSLVSLLNSENSAPIGDSLQIPVGSIADYYDLPTQGKIPFAVLVQMNDLFARGYVEVYNDYFRDQNFMPPIPYSKLNIYNDFLGVRSDQYSGIPVAIDAGGLATGAVGSGAVIKAVAGEGGRVLNSGAITRARSTFNILQRPLKACKLHDAFTSVLPSPQKGPDVTFSVSGELPVTFSLGTQLKQFGGASGDGLRFRMVSEGVEDGVVSLGAEVSDGSRSAILKSLVNNQISGTGASGPLFNGWNVEATADMSNAIGVTINELRTAIATQQVLELLARGGSRYWSFLKSFFQIEADNPFPDIPVQIGHFRSTLDMYQVAQTSESTEASPQGSLAAFGYSTSGAGLLTKTFLEHGFIHIFAVIRHKSVYPTYTPPHLFKRNTMDFYLPQLANIGEQPIRLAHLNPFRVDAMEKVIGYQEAWWDYRYDPDRIRGSLRSGLGNSLDVWHLGNYFDGNFSHVNGDWLKSDSQEILDRTLRVTSDIAPQFIVQFDFLITKQRPMPTYSIPGLDTI